MQSSPVNSVVRITKRARNVLFGLGILVVVTVSLFILRSGQPTRIPLWTQAWGMPVVISRDGRSVATANTDLLQIYDIPTGRSMNLRYQGMDQFYAYRLSCNGIAFSPDSKTVVCGGSPPGSPGSTLNAWDVSSGRHLRTFAIGQVYGQAVIYSPNGNSIATGGKAGILLWDARSGVQIGALNGPGNITSLAFSPNGRYLVSGGMAPDHQIECWDFLTHKVLWNVTSPETWTSSVAFSPDGRCIATGGTNGVVYIWDAKTGDHVKIIPVERVREGPADIWLGYLSFWTRGLIRGHNDVNRYDVATSVLYSSDGKLLIAGGTGGVHIFSASSYKLLRRLNASGPIAMFPDNKRLITAAPAISRDSGKVEVWTLDPS